MSDNRPCHRSTALPFEAWEIIWCPCDDKGYPLHSMWPRSNGYLPDDDIPIAEYRRGVVEKVDTDDTYKVRFDHQHGKPTTFWFPNVKHRWFVIAFAPYHEYECFRLEVGEK